MATIPESAIYKKNIGRDTGTNARPAPRFRVGLVAAVSALAGGVAAAWVYRKTLAQLQQAEYLSENRNLGTLGRSDEGDDA
jgi:hypothetical protein